MVPMLGQIVLFAGNFAPKGWELCAGQLMPVNQNLALFSLLGTTFGGDGTNDFALPDLRSHAPVSGSNYIIAVEGTFPSRV
jgi:microcystin-dependent protein